MKNFAYVCLVFVILVTTVAVVNSVSVSHKEDDILKTLDVTLKSRPQYIKQQHAMIDSLVGLIEDTDEAQLGDLYFRIADRYTAINFDSTRVYYNRASRSYKEAGKEELSALTGALEGTMIATLGALPEGLKMFSDGEKMLKTDSIKAYYYLGGIFLYQALLAIQPDATKENQSYRRQLAAFVDSLQKYSREESVRRHYANALKYESEGKQSLMVAELNDVLDLASPNSQIYGPAASKLGDYYVSRSDNEEAVYYYAIAAINAVRSCEFTANALHRLGVLLNRTGDINHSFIYLTASFREAIASDNRMRSMHAADAFPLVDNAYRHRHSVTLTSLRVVSVVLFVALLAIAWLLWQQRRLRADNKKARELLEKANRQKISNVSHFLSLSSMYLERFDEFRRIVRRKLKAGQIDDLYSMINSNRAAEHQAREFLNIFDRTFLYIFPNFINEVNTLLRDDSKFDPNTGDKLSAELRILAFLRLGVDDCNRIAKFMGLSINTIYTYRNKLKGRAKSRDTFEEELLKIPAL